MMTGRIGLALVLGAFACKGVTPTEPNTPSDPTLVFSTFEQHTWGVAAAGLTDGEAHALPLPAQNQDDYPDISFFEPRWSSDGRYLAYRASNTGTDNWYLVLSDPAGGFKRVLTPLRGYAEGVLWSPRGDRFLYHWGGFIGGRGGMTIQTALVDTLGRSIFAAYSLDDPVVPGLQNAGPLRELAAATPGSDITVVTVDAGDHRLELPAGRRADGRWYLPRVHPEFIAGLEEWVRWRWATSTVVDPRPGRPTRFTFQALPGDSLLVRLEGEEDRGPTTQDFRYGRVW